MLWGRQLLAALFNAAIKTPGFDTGGHRHVRTVDFFILPDPGGLVCWKIPRQERVRSILSAFPVVGVADALP